MRSEKLLSAVYAFSASSSIKAVAHLLIRAEAPTNYSDKKDEDEKKKNQNSISKEAI